MGDLREEFFEKMKAKRTAMDAIIQAAHQFKLALEALQQELIKFVEGVPGITVTNMTRPPQDIYGELMTIPVIHIQGNAAIFQLNPIIQLGGNEPNVTQFQVSVAATKLMAPFDGKYLYYDPSTQTFLKSSGVTVIPDRPPQIIGTPIEIDDFKRAIIYAMT